MTMQYPTGTGAGPASDRARNVRLVTDIDSLRRQLRYAFAHHFTVVQELLQNARRAGATRVLIDYDADTRRLVVDDDGGGVEDFQTLLTFAASGWSDAVAQAERPYGMGFLAAIYAATSVEVQSRGQALVFDTERLLADESFSLTPLPEGTRARPGTRVVLVGIDLRQAGITMENIGRGFAIPLVFNNRALDRPDAIDSRQFEDTPVGAIWSSGEYRPGSVTMYLQGFRVYGHSGAPSGIVHLDGRRYRGKFPDRDRVLEEAAVLREVDVALRELLVRRLDRMRQALPDLDFCRQAYDLALSLGRLDVFNEIPVLPGSWLGRIVEMPHARPDGEGDLVRDLECAQVTQADYADGTRKLALLGRDTFFALVDDESGSQPAWIYAYACHADVLWVTLDPGHWVYSVGAIRPESEVDIHYEEIARGALSNLRTDWLTDVEVAAASLVTLHGDLGSFELVEPFALAEDGQVTIVVPCTKDEESTWRPRCVDGQAVKQCYSYVADDQVDEAAVNVDLREVNNTARRLLAQSPAAALERLLRDALGSYGTELGQFSRVALAIDGEGVISVAEAVPSTSPADRPI